MTHLQLICDCRLSPRIDDRDSKTVYIKSVTPRLVHLYLSYAVPTVIQIKQTQ